MESIPQPHSTQTRIQELDGVKFARFDVPNNHQGHTFAMDAFGEGVPTEKIPIGPYNIKIVLTSEFLAHFASIEKFKSDEGFSHLLVPRKIAEAKITFWYVNSHGKREGTIQLETKEGRLCAICLDLPETEIHDAVHQASQTVSAILDTIALRARIPLQVRNLEVTCPHEPKFRRSYLTIPYSDAWMQESDIVNAASVPQRLGPAIRLFREAISSSKPHYRLLCLYRAREALHVVHRENDQELRKTGLVPQRPERRVPDNVATRHQFAPLIGKKVGALFDYVRNGFRLPIAHGNRSKNGRLELDPADVRTDHRVDAANSIMIELIAEAISDEMALMRQHSLGRS
jgi:hypothetical protein